MKFKILLLVIFTGYLHCFAKTYPFTVNIKESSDIDLIAGVDLNKFVSSFNGNPSLFRIEGKKRIPVPSQTDDNHLVWIIEGPVKAGIIHYEIEFGKIKDLPVEMKALKNNGQLFLKYKDQNLLDYHFETIYPPAGVDTAYKRSAFIHPLWTPHGQELTRIQPPDHYHHYGIWNPWTRVLFEGDTVDFWNLKDRKGTERFAGFTNIIEGPVYCEYEAHHQHIAFKKDKTEKIALDEWQKVRVYRPHNDIYVVDLTINYKCAENSPFKILEYRYAGLGWRATGEWDDHNSAIITSEGKTRENADGSLAKWFIYQGKLGNDSGGMAWLSNPQNYNHPEPIRIWPVGMNQRGDVYANFCPTKNKDWLLEPGKNYMLKYRFIVFNGYMSPEKVRKAWDYYSGGLNISQ